MKQYITIAQWFDLNNIQQEKLLDWSIKHQYAQSGYYLPTIGEMIEFLEDNKCAFGLEADMGIISIYKFNGYEEKEEVAGNICDGLWSMVKEILEK